jgi:hypothetical protein
MLQNMHGILGTVVGNEYKWMGFKFIRNNPNAEQKDIKRIEDSFRPKMPSTWLTNDHEWLTNEDIENVMKQYEASIPRFAFLGVYPIDFNEILANGNCVSTEICKLDIIKMRNHGIHHVGIVFNLDRHDEPGSHWVALYLGLDRGNKNYGAFYYDSVSSSPPRYVLKLLEEVRQQFREFDQEDTSRQQARVCENKIQKQFDNSECGVFSMFFIICCAAGVPFETVCEKMGSDEEVHQLRKVFFRPPDY